jgi:hypothetical protein
MGCGLGSLSLEVLVTCPTWGCFPGLIEVAAYDTDIRCCLPPPLPPTQNLALAVCWCNASPRLPVARFQILYSSLHWTHSLT